jgi:HPt (histidine-containing phosphotransfer) domain-containing protein
MGQDDLPLRVNRPLSGESVGGAAALDLSILCAQTGGDPNLEREVLGLYRSRCPADLARLKAAATVEARRRAAHAMVGSARAVGAEGVARLAAAVERGNASVIAALDTAVADACRFIDAHLAE